MNSSQTNFDFINVMRAHKSRVLQTGKLGLSVPFLTGNTNLPRMRQFLMTSLPESTERRRQTQKRQYENKD